MSYVRIAGTGTAEAFVVGVDSSFHKTSQGEQLRKNLNAFAGQGSKGGFLGGSRSQYINAAAETIVPEWWDVKIDWRHIGGLTVQARVEVYTTNAATSVTPRVKNVTDAADFDGTASTAVSWAAQTIVITAPGVLAVKTYRLYVVPSNATHGVAAMGAIEIYDTLF